MGDWHSDLKFLSLLYVLEGSDSVTWSPHVLAAAWAHVGASVAARDRPKGLVTPLKIVLESVWKQISEVFARQEIVCCYIFLSNSA